MILVFVTTSRRLYLRDVLNIVCMDAGASVRLAYKTTWIQCDPAEDLEEREALLVFCDYDKTTERYTYLPLRAAQLRGVEPDGSGYVLMNARLRGRVKYGYLDGDLAQRLGDFHEKVCAAQARPNTTKEERDQNRDQVFVADLPGNWDELGAVDDGWAELSRYLLRKSSLRDAAFMRGIPAEGRSAEVDWSSGQPRLLVEAGRTYTMRFRMIAGGAANALPTVKMNDHATVLGPFLQQAGGATDAEFAVVVDRSLETRHSMIQLSVASDRGAVVAGPEITGVVQIRPPRAALVGSFLLILCGLVATSVSPDVKDVLKGSDFAGLVYWSVKATGWIMVGVGTWIAGRKLPSKGP